MIQVEEQFSNGLKPPTSFGKQHGQANAPQERRWPAGKSTVSLISRCIFY